MDLMISTCSRACNGNHRCNQYTEAILIPSCSDFPYITDIAQNTDFFKVFGYAFLITYSRFFNTNYHIQIPDYNELSTYAENQLDEKNINQLKAIFPPKLIDHEYNVYTYITYLETMIDKNHTIIEWISSFTKTLFIYAGKINFTINYQEQERNSIPKQMGLKKFCKKFNIYVDIYTKIQHFCPDSLGIRPIIYLVYSQSQNIWRILYHKNFLIADRMDCFSGEISGLIYSPYSAIPENDNHFANIDKFAIKLAKMLVVDRRNQNSAILQKLEYMIKIRPHLANNKHINILRYQYR